MSLTKKDRKIRSTNGRMFPEGSYPDSVAFSQHISDALHREYGQTHAAVKSVVAVTRANERAVKNWFDGKNAPRGHHLVALLGNSDCVLETVLLAAGRVEILTAKKIANSRAVLTEMLRLLDELPSSP